MMLCFCPFLAALLLGACAGNAGDEAEAGSKPGWPSLAPRVGEVSPLVPRVPLGVCAACSPDAPGTAPPPLPAMADLPPPVRAVLPDDVEDRLTRIAAILTQIEAAWPAARDTARAAIADAPAGALETEADVQASRFEALFQPLGPEDAALAALEAAIADGAGAAAYAPLVTALRARMATLDAVRATGLSG